MSKISTWSTTAASNNSAAPDGFPEGMAPSGLNNAAREVMASVRTQHEDAQWIDLGNAPTNTSATTFTLVGDQTTAYHVGRRVKCTDATDLYGTISVSAFTSLTTVTVVLDSGVLSGSLTAVALGIIGAENSSHPWGNATDGAVLTGQGSTNDVTIKNDLDEIAANVPTGTKDWNVVGVLTGGGMVIKPSDQVVNNSDSLADDDDLTVAVEANTTYTIEGFLYWTAANTSMDIKFDFTEPASATWMMFRTAVYETSFDADGQYSHNSGAVSLACDSTASSPTLVRLTGTLSTVGTAGNFTLQWSQNVAQVADLTLHKGSFLRLLKAA